MSADRSPSRNDQLAYAIANLITACREAGFARARGDRIEDATKDEDAAIEKLRSLIPSEGASSPAGPARNGEPAAAASIPEEFAQLAKFYDVQDMASLVRMQQEHIEGLQAKLPPTPPFPGLQRVREG